jgi:hypothetical protein
MNLFLLPRHPSYSTLLYPYPYIPPNQVITKKGYKDIINPFMSKSRATHAPTTESSQKGYKDIINPFMSKSRATHAPTTESSQKGYKDIINPFMSKSRAPKRDIKPLIQRFIYCPCFRILKNPPFIGKW